MDKEDYETALKVFNKWHSTSVGGNFHSFLKEKTKPEDPLFEKFKKLYCDVMGRDLNLGHHFIKFKEIFADELNGTRGLDEAMEFFGSHYSGNWPPDSIAEKLKDIKAKLEVSNG